MKLEKLHYFLLLHNASFKKVRKVKKGFSGVATLHFQNYCGCGSVRKSPRRRSPTSAAPHVQGHRGSGQVAPVGLGGHSLRVWRAATGAHMGGGDLHCSLSNKLKNLHERHHVLALRAGAPSPLRAGHFACALLPVFWSLDGDFHRAVYEYLAHICCDA